MVDRLEELLEDEEEREELEDALALRLGTEVPASPLPGIGTEKVLESGGEETGPELEETDNALMRAGQMERTAEVKVAVPEAGGKIAVDAGEAAAEDGSVELLWDGLGLAVMGPDGSMVLRRPGAGDVESAEPARAAERTAAELGKVLETLTTAERGLEGLYRQTAQASRPAAQSLPVEQAGRTVRAEEPGRTAALTVDELDRAVRRDSRRYDGGMTIF